jgi:ribosomal protein S18 acetylase RimI-like enzyme
VRDNRFRFRFANDGDLDVVYDLFAEVQSIHAAAEPAFFRPPVKDRLFERFFEDCLSDPKKNLVLACDESMAVGYVLYFAGSSSENLYQSARSYAYIHQLVVTKRFRRSGCASALIGHVKEEARGKNIRLLGIDFWSFNDAARACFEKNGFKVNQEFMWAHL